MAHLHDPNKSVQAWFDVHRRVVSSELFVKSISIATNGAVTIELVERQNHVREVDAEIVTNDKLIGTYGESPRGVFTEIKDADIIPPEFKRIPCEGVGDNDGFFEMEIDNEQ